MVDRSGPDGCHCLWGFQAWKAERWTGCCRRSGGHPATDRSMFAGGCSDRLLRDGGAMVLATVLMATFYAPRESALSKNWGCVADC